jgi:hypothetical protein
VKRDNFEVEFVQLYLSSSFLMACEYRFRLLGEEIFNKVRWWRLPYI